ncbi:nudix hydrolase 26, chloroplastic-like isoform X2 [Dendrobium catenatum]|uniref:nudix hydrolase 26, chloroplastic-like isoform X2 n=1 Tax=Dendrobium catenatum TaxID=906689 RepID=UPI00109F0233|nr:nudix hydrolase 26, chloroplastic-like isoform X2 [Dendrobium catenatum]
MHFLSTNFSFNVPVSLRGSMIYLCRPLPYRLPSYPALSKYVLSCPVNPPPFANSTGLQLRPQKQFHLPFHSSMEAPPAGYRKNVGICLINSSKKIFSASRLDIPDAWQMPQGGVDEGEDPRDAAIRELMEETGVSSAEILAEVPYWLTYDFPPEVREKLNKQWGSDWKGQAQKWFCFRFVGREEEINLSGNGTEKPEFGEWSWMTPQQVIELLLVIHCYIQLFHL